MKFVLKVIVAFAISFLVWEIVAENLMLKTPGYILHPTLGRIYKQGDYVHGTEGFSRTQINSNGMRGSEISDKAERELRILVLGDSFTEGFQLSDKDILTSRLKDRLQESIEKPLTVINAGRSGAGPAHYIHLADYYNLTFKPDYVVIVLNDGDFIDDIFNKNSNFYVEENEGTFTTKYHNMASMRLFQKYPSLRWLTELSVLRLGMENAKNVMDRKTGFNTNPGAAKVSTAKVAPDFGPVIKWTLQSLNERYSNAIIVYLPSINYTDASGNKSEIEAIIEASAQEKNLTLINMRNSYLSYFENTTQPAHGFHNRVIGSGHINKAGHDLVSQEIAEYIIRKAH